MSENEVGVLEDERMKLRERASGRTSEVPLDLWTPQSPSTHTHSPYFPFEILEEDRGLSQAGELQQQDRRNQQWYTRMGHGEDWMSFYTVEQGLANYGLLPLLIWSANQEWFVHSQMVGGGEKKCPWIKFYWNRAVVICLSTSMAAFKLHW